MTSEIGVHRFWRYAVLAGLGIALLISPLGGLQAEAAQVAIVNRDKLNLRSGPSTQNATVGQAKKGDQLPVLAKSGDWYKVQVAGKTAWVAGWLVGIKEIAATTPSKGASVSLSKVAVVTADSLNVRSGAGTNFAIAGKVKKGDHLTVLSQSGDWLKVQGNGVTGWVAKWLVAVQSVPPPASSQTASAPASSSAKVAVVTSDSLNVRSGAGTNFAIAGKAKKGDRLTVLAQSGDWVKVQGQGITGWVANWLVTIQNVTGAQPTKPAAPAQPPGGSSTQVAVINANNINLRSGPGTDHQVAGQVSRGVRLPVISRSGDWVQVQQENGSKAWIAGWLVAVVEQPEPAQPAQPKPTEPVPSEEPDQSWLPGPTPTPAPTKPVENPEPTQPTPEGQAPQAKLVDVQVNEKKDHTYINIVSDQVIDYHTFTLSNPYRYVVNLNNVQLGKLPDTIEANTNLVERIRTGYNQQPYYSRLVLDLTGRSRVKAELSSDKKTLTLDISEISYSDGLAGKTVFLDAGHGGHDGGASGQYGVKEKDVNLAITLKVAELLRSQGAKVLFSRPDDTFIDLYQRTSMANEQNSDIFVSIHSNANTNRAIAGTSTYYYAPEALPQLYEQKADRQRLAQDVQQELVATLGRRDIGVLQANFAVLRTSVMPSILIETAFVSNNEEEALLGSADFQQRAAEAIARGISSYFNGQ